MTLRHYRAALLTLDSGQIVHLRYFRTGSWTRAYLSLDYKEVYLLTMEADFSKVIFADMDWQLHLPKCERVGSFDGYGVYKMPYYEPIKRGTEAWRQHKILNECLDAAKGRTPYRVNIRFLLNTAGKLPESLRSALAAVIEHARDFGPSYALEFPKRNLGVDEDGNLVLIDPIFDVKEL